MNAYYPLFVLTALQLLWILPLTFFIDLTYSPSAPISLWAPHLIKTRGAWYWKVAFVMSASFVVFWTAYSLPMLGWVTNLPNLLSYTGEFPDEGAVLYGRFALNHQEYNLWCIGVWVGMFGTIISTVGVLYSRRLWKAKV